MMKTSLYEDTYDRHIQNQEFNQKHSPFQ